MFSPWYILLATASSATAAALSRRITYAFSISDFQGHMLDLSDGGVENYTPVQSFTPANTTNQQWALISSQDSRQLWEIHNVGSGTNMAHTTALLEKPGPAIHAQVVGGNQTTWWRMSCSSEGCRFSDADSNLALTAWPETAGYPSSPVKTGFKSQALCITY
ncbi:hypothetical protein GGX14DRAFT_404691 [Mycena pura]|uniref:Ricin B lectin domain-containing protein n=1 Tax=Mycena pura TaxID=153505 RepID=A0AAD6UXW6_9AGAR|nr:hypothetical protein GGX14DRAFT_404691 [Mycena pura]